MKLKSYLIIVLTLFCSVLSYAQSAYEVKGTVKSASDGFPVPGVNVIVKGTANGVATDFDGNYAVKVKSGESLEFSSIGFTTKTIAVTDQKTINVSLVEDSQALDEVVVVGYGTRKKGDVTGAVSSVKSAELNAFPVLDAAQAIQGRAAGVEVQSNNGGQPGAPISIKIRGNTSISASSSPLIVVDGFIGAQMPQSGDIETMEILKDASSTAIYGSRAANGVILVTTKKGKSGRLSFEINSSFSIQNTANELDLLNADDFVAFQNQVRSNQAQTAFAGSGDPADLNFQPYQSDGFNTDWQDLVYRIGSTTNHQFSFSGGTDKIDFYASATYFKQEGIVINSSFERISFLSNINAQLTDKFKVGLNLVGSRGDQRGISGVASGGQSGGSGSSGTDAVIANTFRFAPDIGIFNPDNPALFSQNTKLGDAIDNPLGTALESRDQSEIDDFRANIYFDYEILKGLTFRSTFGISTRNTFRGSFIPTSLNFASGANGLGDAFIDNQRNETILTDTYLTYKTEIGKGNLTLLAGYSYQDELRTGSRVQGATTFDTQEIIGLGTSTGLENVGNQIFNSPREVQSFFGRVNYDFDDRYLLTASIRHDEASVFSPGEKTAVFPSAAIGWKISSEEFLADVDAISNLKVRASYGQTGNQAIPPFGTQDALLVIVAQDGAAVTPGQPANNNLKWETSTQFNVGLDLGLFNNKVVFSAEYYNIDTDDLILTDPTNADIQGFQNAQNIRANIGEINNKGFELSLSTTNISTDDFRWTTDLVFSRNISEVTKLIGNDLDLTFSDGIPSYFDSTPVSIFREGEALAQFFGFEYAGVFQGGVVPDGFFTQANPVAGDPLFVDQGGDDANGTLGTEDRVIIGDPNPDFTYGITNNFTYKNWDLNIFFQGSQGGDIFNITDSALSSGDANTTVDNLNAAYSATNLDSNTPRVGNNSSREISSRFVEDGSYLRLKNIAIGYNLPADLLDNIGVQSLRLSLSAQNLITFTSYSGLDPEVNFAGNPSTENGNTTIGFDFGNYPTVQSVTLGLNIKF